MKLAISSTEPKMLISATPQQPVDVTVQNISANTIYLCYNSSVSVTNDGLKLNSGETYTNDVLVRPLYAIADVDASEIRVEYQPSWVAWLAHILSGGRIPYQ